MCISLYSLWVSSVGCFGALHLNADCPAIVITLDGRSYICHNFVSLAQPRKPFMEVLSWWTLWPPPVRIGDRGIGIHVRRHRAECYRIFNINDMMVVFIWFTQLKSWTTRVIRFCQRCFYFTKYFLVHQNTPLPVKVHSCSFHLKRKYECLQRLCCTVGLTITALTTYHFAVPAQ